MLVFFLIFHFTQASIRLLKRYILAQKNQFPIQQEKKKKTERNTKQRKHYSLHSLRFVVQLICSVSLQHLQEKNYSAHVQVRSFIYRTSPSNRAITSSIYNIEFLTPNEYKKKKYTLAAVQFLCFSGNSVNSNAMNLTFQPL